MSGAGIVKLLSYFLEWLLSYYQDTVEGIITMLSSGQTDGALMWLMKSWKSLFIALIVCGIILNIVIFVARWKPYWWWFAKKRMIVNDELLNKRKKSKKNTTSHKRPARTPSTIVRRKDASQTLQLSTIAPVPARKTTAKSLFEEDADELLIPHKKNQRRA